MMTSCRSDGRKRYKPILKYAGGKWRIAEWILSYFPPHKVYLEPFFGSGAIFFNKEPSYVETINDIDGNIVNLFKVCRNYPDELARAVSLTPFSREEFIDCYCIEDSDPIERARRTLVRYHQSFGTCNITKKSWRYVKSSGGPRCATMWNYLPDTIKDCCNRLRDAQIECCDAISLIKQYNSRETLIYCDPPYLPELRKKRMYKHEYSADKHLQLLRTLKKSSSSIIISGYDNELYNSELSSWFTAETDTTAQMGLARTEKLWMNFIPDDVQMKFTEVD